MPMKGINGFMQITTAYWFLFSISKNNMVASKKATTQQHNNKSNNTTTQTKNKTTKTKMKLCMVSKYFYPHEGGIETNVHDIAKQLSEEGETVQVVCSNSPKSKKYEKKDGFEIYRSRPFFTLFNTPFFPGCFIDLMRNDYDLIHIHLPDPFGSFFTYIAAKLRRKPIVATYHADIYREGWFYKPFWAMYNIFLKLFLRSCRNINVTSLMYASGSPYLRDFQDKLVQIPSWVDLRKFNPTVNGSEIRKKHKIGDRKVILFTGRLVPYKGLRYLIEAFPLIKKEISDAVLVVVGEGPLEEDLKSLAKGDNDIIFAGRVTDSELPKYYAMCDVFVLPSVTRQEAYGLVMVEVMACGKPLISTNFSGMPFVVGESGFVVPPRDPKALSEAILRVLKDDALRERLGRISVRRSKEIFSRDVVLKKLEEVYEAALKR